MYIRTVEMLILTMTGFPAAHSVETTLIQCWFNVKILCACWVVTAEKKKKKKKTKKKEKKKKKKKTVKFN